MFPVHIFLFAIYPILFLYSINMDEISFVDTLLPMVFSCAFAAAVCWIVYRLAYKNTKRPSPQKDDLKQKAALWTAFFLIVFFGYGNLVEAKGDIKNATGIGLSNDEILFYLLGFLAVGTIYVVRAKDSMKHATAIATIVSATLVIGALTTAGGNFLQAGGPQQAPKQEQEEVAVSPEILKNRPDIYYLIFDGYPRADVIKDYLHGDNSEFITALEKRGFYLPPKTCANYPRTFLSITSTLNMEYVNYLAKAKGRKDNYKLYTDLIPDYAVQKFLRGQGYHYVHVGSWSPPFKKNDNAQVNIPGPTDDFTLLLLKNTLLSRVVKQQLYYETLRNHVLYSLDQLETRVPKLDLGGPKFVFAHVICPHDPFHFNEVGGRNKVANDDPDMDKQKRAFNAQLTYLNGRILKIVDNILANSANSKAQGKTPPVIILQGDHGTGMMGGLKSGDWNPKYVRERLGILNAYHLPNNGANNAKNVVYSNITPVNTFRRVFNYYLGSNFAPLPDEQYFIFSDKPYVYYNMTGKGDCGP